MPEITKTYPEPARHAASSPPPNLAFSLNFTCTEPRRTVFPIPDLAVESDPASSSSRSSSTCLPEEDITSTNGATAEKRKEKKKNKVKQAVVVPDDAEDAHPSVLCISRNKHWRYISSYHGPWLQLPVEVLESLDVLNITPSPCVFRSVAGIRMLVDETFELSVRGSSGLSAAALGSTRSGGSPVNNSP
ncbi:hypothetical protein OF83DRAFT_1174532 [Amylostereum chailletii]|nr:hypothetical protein OF83DRAFT_1174532 [Amylostereum chailletii]